MPNSAVLARSVSTCFATDRVLDGLVGVLGRDVVVLGGDGEVGPPDRAAVHAQAVEGLGRRDLVDEVEIDVEQVGLAGRDRTTWRSQIFWLRVRGCVASSASSQILRR